MTTYFIFTMQYSSKNTFSFKYGQKASETCFRFFERLMGNPVCVFLSLSCNNFLATWGQQKQVVNTTLAYYHLLMLSSRHRITALFSPPWQFLDIPNKSPRSEASRCSLRAAMITKCELFKDIVRARRCIAETWKMCSRLSIWLCWSWVREPYNELQPMRADTPLLSSAVQ